MLRNIIEIATDIAAIIIFAGTVLIVAAIWIGAVSTY